MTTEDFAVQLMWLLIFLMIFVGSLCVLAAIFDPSEKREYRMPLDFNDDRRRAESNARKAWLGWRS